MFILVIVPVIVGKSAGNLIISVLIGLAIAINVFVILE